MLHAVRTADGADDLIRDAAFGIGAEGRVLVGIISTHGLEQADHALLDHVFRIRAGHEVGTGFFVDDAGVLPDESLLCERVSRLGFRRQLNLRILYGVDEFFFKHYSLCFTTSYMMMAAALDALRELTLPFIGMLTTKSHFSRTRRLMPNPSLPMTIAAGPVMS